MTERKIIITDDEHVEKFTQPICTCKICKGMNTGSTEWESFVPKNNLQRRMKDIVARIEKREEIKRKRASLPSEKEGRFSKKMRK